MDLITRTVFSTKEISDMDHIEFWLKQFIEHSLFIELGIVDIDDECTEIRNNANKWQKKWTKLLESYIERSIDERIDLYEKIYNNAIKFSDFKKDIYDLTVKKFTGWLVPGFIDHIKSEVDYFINVWHDENLSDMDKLLFWIEISQEHMEFTVGLLDNNEKELIKKAMYFAKEFETLKKCKECHNDYMQFSLLSLHCSKELDKFISSGQKGVKDRSIKSTFHPLLIDHVKRETQRSIFEINKIINKLDNI